MTTSTHPLPNAEPRQAETTSEIQSDAKLLDHEYDGIREYDNPMPRWWRWIFWASFYYSLGYLVHYHVTGNGPTVLGEYEAEVALAREAEAASLLGSEVTEDSLAKFVEDPGLMADAAQLFAVRCGPCHGAAGEGVIGPNLTDDHWLNGDATLMSLYRIVNEGVVAKGMPAWNRQLRPIEVAKLAAYLGTLRGTNRPGKAAEGRHVPNR